MPASPAYHFLTDCLSFILIDLLLAGDNARVIGMAVRALPPRQRRAGIIFGAASAVLLRVIITIAATELLGVPGIKLVGGALVIWIAVKVLTDAASPPPDAAAPVQFLRAIWLITVADITMSADNFLAGSGGSPGSRPLVAIRLGPSLPFVQLS